MESDMAFDDTKQHLMRSFTHKRNKAKYNFTGEHSQDVEKTELKMNNFLMDGNLESSDNNYHNMHISSDIFTQPSDYHMKKIICDLDDMKLIEEDDLEDCDNIVLEIV